MFNLGDKEGEARSVQQEQSRSLMKALLICERVAVRLKDQPSWQNMAQYFGAAKASFSNKRFTSFQVV